MIYNNHTYIYTYTSVFNRKSILMFKSLLKGYKSIKYEIGFNG